MSLLKPRNAAEASDLLAMLTAAASGLAALVFSINVAEVFVPETVAALLGWVQVIGGIVILAIFAPIVILLKSRGGRAGGRGAGGSYFNALVRRASVTAFEATLACLIVLSLLDRTVLGRISAEVAVDGVITFMLAAFALFFLVIERFGRLDEAEGGDA